MLGHNLNLNYPIGENHNPPSDSSYHSKTRAVSRERLLSASKWLRSEREKVANIT